MKKITKQDENEMWKREGNEVVHSYYGTGRGTQSPRDLLFIVVPYLMNYYTYAVSMKSHQQQHHPREREEEDVVVLLSFVWFPLDNTLYITPVIQY